MMAEFGRNSLLFIGPLPEPTTGHSLACKVLYDSLSLTWRVEIVNLNKSTFRQGVSSLGRVFEVARAILRVWYRRRCSSLYFTISESFAGNLKDLVIFAVCFRNLRRMTIHLHGGAGLRQLFARRPFLAMLNRFFIRRLGAVIVLGERHLSIFSGFVGRDRLHVVRNFAQDELFVDDSVIARKFNAPRPLQVLFLSNLLPGKGHDELLEAFWLLDAAEQAQISLDFAGGFESHRQEGAFRARAQHDSIRVHGPVHGDQKRALFAAAQVFCLPTYYPYEGQPISILEAYASGCAVITTDHSGIFDVFDDGRNGYAVVKRSPESIAGALRRALASRGELRQFGLNNAAEARANYRAADYSRAVNDILVQMSPSGRAQGQRAFGDVA